MTPCCWCLSPRTQSGGALRAARLAGHSWQAFPIHPHMLAAPVDISSPMTATILRFPRAVPARRTVALFLEGPCPSSTLHPPVHDGTAIPNSQSARLLVAGLLHVSIEDGEDGMAGLVLSPT